MRLLKPSLSEILRVGYFIIEWPPLSAWADVFIASILSMPEDHNRRWGLFIDELVRQLRKDDARLAFCYEASPCEYGRECAIAEMVRAVR